MPIDQPFDFEIDGLKMKNYAYPQEGDLKGVIYYVPGFGDHGKHYGYFFEQFAKAGFLTLT
jgi:alpha-beta hydrolase superfamily lysophospholipase